MITLKSSMRAVKGKKTKTIRDGGLIPAVLYGPELKPQELQVSSKEFILAYQQAGESTLLDLNIEGKSKKYPVIIHHVQKDPLSDKIIHIDFFQPKLTEKMEADVPIVFMGESPAVKEFGGTLIKNLQELPLKALPQKLPKEIKVDVGTLKAFSDKIRIKDLNIPQEIEVLQHALEDIVAQVTEPEKVTEELEKPIEEKVEEVEKVEKPKKEKEDMVEEKPEQPSQQTKNPKKTEE